MKIDTRSFFRACNPSKTISMSHLEDSKYYVDFSPVRGGNVVDIFKRTIATLSANEPTCQLFTGHIGCGKSTELLRLKYELEQLKFRVVYFESTQDLDLADVDVSDILLTFIHQVCESLENINLRFDSKYFAHLLESLKEYLDFPIDDFQGSSFTKKIALVSSIAKRNSSLRSRLRQYLGPRTNSILRAINNELLYPINKELKKRGYQGLVVIIDNLDRIDSRFTVSGRSQPEYLFIDRGEHLRGLDCHLVYTVPLSLSFSNESEALRNRLGGGIEPQALPMIPTINRDGSIFEPGINLLRQMVLIRALPDVENSELPKYLTDIFDSPETLDRVCRISGGHVRNLLGLIYRCLQLQDLPIDRQCLETVIREERDRFGTGSVQWDSQRDYCV